MAAVAMSTRATAGLGRASATPSAVRGLSAVGKQTSVRRAPLAVRASADEPKPTAKATTSEIKDNASPTPAPAPAPTPAPTGVSLFDAMSFSGPAPEVINGRLAMLGFIAALGAELATNETVAAQFSQIPGPMVFVIALFTTASLVPLVKQGKKQTRFGPFTPQAEMLNGRAAMLGFAALLVAEAVRGSPLF